MTRSDKYQSWQWERAQDEGPKGGSSKLDTYKPPWACATRQRTQLVSIESVAWKITQATHISFCTASLSFRKEECMSTYLSEAINVFSSMQEKGHLILCTSQTQLPAKPTTCLTLIFCTGPLTRYKSWTLRAVLQGLNSWSDLCQLLLACWKTKRAFQFSSIGLAKPQHSQLSPAGFDSELLFSSTW